MRESGEATMPNRHSLEKGKCVALHRLAAPLPCGMFFPAVSNSPGRQAYNFRSFTLCT